VLLALGAQPLRRSRDGRTAQEHAHACGHSAVARVLDDSVSEMVLAHYYNADEAYDVDTRLIERLLESICGEGHFQGKVGKVLVL
jgi:hypothetical protein